MNTKKLLLKLEKTFRENGLTEAQVLLKDETGLEADILATRHRGFGSISNTAEGEFSFFEDEDGAALFTCRLTVLKGIKESALPLVCATIVQVNAGIPLGGFAYDPLEDSVFYALRTPFPASLSEKELAEEADSCTALSLSVAERYCTGIIRNAGDIGMTG